MESEFRGSLTKYMHFNVTGRHPPQAALAASDASSGYPTPPHWNQIIHDCDVMPTLNGPTNIQALPESG